eukprot:2331250-Alexandrium_andersonii.AAC.1
MPEQGEQIAAENNAADGQVTPTNDNTTLGELMDQLCSSAPPGLESRLRSPKRNLDADEQANAPMQTEEAHDPLAAQWRAVQTPFDPNAVVVDDDGAPAEESPRKAQRTVMALEIHSVQLNRDGVCEEPEPTPKLSWEETIQGLPADLVKKGDAKEIGNLEAFQVYSWIKREEVPPGSR